MFVARVELGFAAPKINLGDNFILKWGTIQPFEAYSLEPLQRSFEVIQDFVNHYNGNNESLFSNLFTGFDCDNRFLRFAREMRYAQNQ